MTLPNMKIYTGGDREYSERVQRALFELGVPWHFGGFCIQHTDSLALVVEREPRILHYCTNKSVYRGDGANPYRLAPNGTLVPQEADDEGWIAWGGGKCPVDPTAPVDIRLRNGKEQHGERRARGYRWDFRLDQGDIIAYRVPSQIFATSQRKPEPVHKIKEGDYVDNDDIADRQVFESIIAECERQGISVATERDFVWEMVSDNGRNLLLCGAIGVGSTSVRETDPSWYRRITPADLGITTQEADMTPCEQKGLRERQWVWFKEGPAETGWKGYGWAQLIKDDGTEQPRFIDGRGCPQWLLLKDIDWQAGIRNEKPVTEDSMSETPGWDGQGLPPVGNVCEVVDSSVEGGFVECRILAHLPPAPHPDYDKTDTAVYFAPSKNAVGRLDADAFRRKPRTVRIEGEISENSIAAFRSFRDRHLVDAGEVREAVNEVLNAVDQ